MPSQQNIEKVKEIKARLEDVEAAYFADYRGLTVPDIAEVRTALLEAEAQFAVVKNTLTRLAVRELDLEALEQFIDGPTAVAFVRGDIVMGAKALVDAAKKYDVLQVRGGIAEGRVLTGDQVTELASLDTHEQMLARVAGMLSAHMRKAAFLFQALQSKLVSLMEAYARKLEEEAPADEAAAEAKEAPEESGESPETEEAAETEEAPAEAAHEAPAEEADEPAPQAEETDEEQEEG